MLTGKPECMVIPWEGHIMRAIYKWTNLQNNKVYIGKSVDISRRLRDYRHEVNNGSTRPIISALRKYGFENFKFEIVEECNNLTDAELLEREQFWMDQCESQNPNKGYNISNAEETPLGQYSVGSKNIKARLNEEEVLNIREMIYLQNISPAIVYKMYANEISYDAFAKAYRGHTWNNVETSMIRNLNSEVERKGKPKSKLTLEDVREIRKIAEEDHLTISEIYEQYLGVCTRGTIKRVVNYKTWKYV